MWANPEKVEPRQKTHQKLRFCKIFLQKRINFYLFKQLKHKLINFDEQTDCVF